MFAAVARRRSLLIAALAALLVSCTFTKFAYNQADTVAAWKIDEYFDLDGQQKQEFSKRFDRLYAWHRQEQLPEYAQFMRTARGRMQDGTSREDVLWFVDGMRTRVRTLARQAAPDAAALLATVTPAQIDHLKAKFEKENRKYAREHKVNGTLEERQEAEAKRVIKQVKEWLAPLTNEQEQRVTALLRDGPQLEKERYAERLRRQRDLIEVLSHRNEDSQRFTARLTEWMVNWERGRPVEYQKQLDQSWQRRAELLATVDRMLTPDQRNTSLQKIQGYADDFIQLAGAPRRDAGRTAAAK